MSNFKVDLLAAAQSYVPHTAVTETNGDYGPYLVDLDDAITDLLKNDYPNVDVNPVILPGDEYATLHVIADEDYNKTDDTFEAVYNIQGQSASFLRSGTRG